MLKSYFKDRKIVVFLLLIFYGSLFLIGYLYRLPSEKTMYIAEISFSGSFLCLLSDLFRYMSRWRELKQFLGSDADFTGSFHTSSGELEQLYRELIYRMKKEKEEFLCAEQERYTDMMDYYGMWAHQIKTPIAAMKILIQSDKETCLTVKDRERYDALQLELFKTEQYVEMVLSYLKIGDISKDMVISYCDLGNLVRQTVKKYSRLFYHRKLSLALDEIHETILTDEKWLSFVIEQILSNALKYTKTGKISIYMEEKGVLAIKDTGIGISSEDLPRIMEKGYTGYNGRNDKKATGIGLYLCKKIMDKLQHDVKIESEPGKGTKVLLNFNRKELHLE